MLCLNESTLFYCGKPTGSMVKDWAAKVAQLHQPSKKPATTGTYTLKSIMAVRILTKVLLHSVKIADPSDESDV